MVRHIVILDVQSPMDIIYIRGLVDGVEHNISVKRADLAALPTRAARRLFVAQALIGREDARLVGPFADLLGDLDV
jgi:hypothetical protein